LRAAGLPALRQALARELNRTLSAEPRTPLQQWHRLIGEQLPAGDLQLLPPLIPDHRFEVQHPPAIAQPALSRSGWDFLALPLRKHLSAHLRCPPPLADHVVRPPLAAADQVRETEISKDGHRYTNRTSAAVISFLRTVVMNLMRRGGYGSAREGNGKVYCDIKGMHSLGGVQLTENVI
jgi:hypothetical protein